MATALRLRLNTLPLPAMPAPVDPLRLLPDYARAEAERRAAIIRQAVVRVNQGVCVTAAARWLATSADGMPDERTLRRWIKDYTQGGIVELAPKYQPRQRKDRGWEARALQLYNRPQRPGYATVALWLREEGFADADSKAVARYIKAAPAQLGTVGKKRLGVHYYNQNVRPHVVRDSSVLPVGLVYEGDGHCCDVYVAHPAKGHFRPELTIWIDVRSHYVVGWWISESESAHTTLYSLSRALLDHNHVPAFVHTDPGSGFKARMICDETAGFLAKFGIQPMLALPGNARGKGLVEGWFRWFEERLGKRYETFCGHCRTDDALSRLKARIDRGEIALPSLAQYIEGIRAYIAWYNNNPQDNLAGRTPASLWAELEQVSLEMPGEAILRPRERRTVQRWGVRLDSRKYRHHALQAFEGRDVIVEYSIHDDDRVWVLDAKGRQICEAMLVDKAPWMPASRVEQAQIKRLEGQRERRAIRDETDAARARMPLSAAQVLGALDMPPEEAALTRPPHDIAALEQGHSVSVPTSAPEARAATPRPVSANAEQLVSELMRESLIPETASERFALYRRLLAQRDANEPVSEDLAEWAAIYETTPECAGIRLVLDDLGDQ